MIQKLLKEGFPEHIIADGIVHVCLYMGGSKNKRDEKGQLFNQRFRLSGLDGHGKELKNYVKEHFNESLEWASEHLTEYLPEELKSEYLEHYLAFCATGRTLWLGELYLIHFLSDLFGYDIDELDDRLIRYEGLTTNEIYSDGSQDRGIGLDSVMSEEQVFNTVREMRNKYELPSVGKKLDKDIALNDEQKESDDASSLISVPGSSGNEIEQTVPSQNKNYNIADGDKKQKDESDTDNIGKGVLIAVTSLIFIFILIEISQNSDFNSNSADTTTGQTESVGRNNVQGADRDYSDDAIRDVSANTQLIDMYVYNESEVRAYSNQGRNNKVIAAQSVYKVINENSNLITFMTSDGPYYAYKSNFQIYEEVPFKKKFKGNEIIALEDVDLRDDLSYASYSNWYFPESSIVQITQETTTSVEITTRDGLFWADKSSFVEYDENEIVRNSKDSAVNSEKEETEKEVEYFSRFVDLSTDANVRSSPSIFADTEFKLERGKRLLVTGRVTGTIFYQVSISGKRYYVSETAIRF